MPAGMFGGRGLLQFARGNKGLLAAVALGVIGKDANDADERPACRSLPAYEHAIARSRSIVGRFLIESAAPGLSVGVSVNGKLVWKDGFGYADVENLVPCHADTVMRIASISKPITAALVGRLVEQGRLDLDASVRKYVPDFPEKRFRDAPVVITTRQLVSHLGGIRHYTKAIPPTDDGKGTTSERTCEKCKRELTAKKPDDALVFEPAEFFNRTPFKGVKEALSMFKDDELVGKPGEHFLYTTHGWTLVSAVVEAAAGANRSFAQLLSDLFDELHMHDTFLDENTPLIFNRTKYYWRTPRHKLRNSPEVDNSYKWAGGGILSNVTDLLRFADATLRSYQYSELCGADVGRATPPQKWSSPLRRAGASALHSCSSCCRARAFLESDTMRMLWTPVDGTKLAWAPAGRYAMGWGVVPRSGGVSPPEYFTHTGGAVGATSVLIIRPSADKAMAGVSACAQPCLPRGVCVAVLVNMEDAGGINALGVAIAREFAACED